MALNEIAFNNLPFNFIKVYIGVKTANMVSKNTYIGLKIGKFYIKIAN